MKTKRTAQNIFIIFYSALLILFTLYAALDTFVIPRRLAVAEAASAGSADIAAAATGTESVEAAVGSPVPSTSSGTDGSGSGTASGNSSGTASGNGSGNNGSGAAATPGALPDIGGTVIGTYEDAGIFIRITQINAYDTEVYVADIALTSPGYLQTALADNAYGRNIKEETSEIAKDQNAILAINGDFYGSRNEGYVIRNGVLYRDTAGRDREDLVIYADGTFAIIEEQFVTAQELLAQGAAQVFSFGPALLTDGKITVSQNEEVGKAMASNPRTAIGICDDLHYVFVVSDGRTNASEGLSLYELAEVMQLLGVTCAYNLDGGGSSTMVFQGEVVNNPTTRGNRTSEREVSDIVYIGGTL